MDKGGAMTLSELMTAAEMVLGRTLWDDEIVVVGQMQKAGKDINEVLAVLDAERPQVKDEDLSTVRFEPAGKDGVRRIQ